MKCNNQKHQWTLTKDYNFDNSKNDHCLWTCLWCDLQKRMYLGYPFWKYDYSH